MKQRLKSQAGSAEMELQITWHQWHDGRWEAWVTDASGQPPCLVRDRAELERFLFLVSGSGSQGHPIKSDSNAS